MCVRLAKYPHISPDETFTVHAIIKGLEHHPTLKHLPDNWAETASVPTTVLGISRLNAVKGRTTAE